MDGESKRSEEDEKDDEYEGIDADCVNGIGASRKSRSQGRISGVHRSAGAMG